MRVFNLLIEVTLVTLLQNTAQIGSGVYGIWGDLLLGGRDDGVT